MTDLFTFKPRDPYFGSTVALKAAEFDRENPQVYRLFIRFALEAKRAGLRKFGSSAIFERIRWEIAILTSDKDFKLNNNHRAYFARKAMMEFTELAGFFETRSA